MKEIERIDKNTKAETPKGDKTTITVTGIENPQQNLDTCKNVVKAFLGNSKLDKKSDDWKTLFPQTIVSFIDSLDKTDFDRDELLYPMADLVDDLQKLRQWEWYSSKLDDGGFVIVTTGSFHPRFVWMLHCQGIPYSKIFVEDDKFGSYNMRITVVDDVIEYKQ